MRAIHQLRLQHAVALVGFDGPSREIVLFSKLVERGSSELAAS